MWQQYYSAAIAAEDIEDAQKMTPATPAQHDCQAWLEAAKLDEAQKATWEHVSPQALNFLNQHFHVSKGGFICEKPQDEEEVPRRRPRSCGPERISRALSDS